MHDSVWLLGVTQAIKSRPHWFGYPATLAAGFLISTTTFQVETRADITSLRASGDRIEKKVDQIEARQRDALLDAATIHAKLAARDGETDVRLKYIEARVK